MNDNLSLIQQLFGFYAKGDVASFLSLFSADAVWVEPGEPGDIPYAGSFTGLAGISQLLTILSKSVHIKKFVPTLFVTEGDNVVVFGDNDAEVIATGKSYSTKWVYAFTVTSGKVSHLQVFFDTLTVAKAFSH